MLTEEPREASSAEPADLPRVEAAEEGGVLRASLSGSWTTRTVHLVDARVRELERSGAGAMEIDISGVGKMDTAGAWLIQRLVAAGRHRDAGAKVTGASKTASILLDAVGQRHGEGQVENHVPRRNPVIVFFDRIGRVAYASRTDLLYAMNILGATIRGSQMKLGRGHGLNVTAIVHQIDRIGVGAIPVVLLMSTVVGAIVAQQAAFQLRYFGAEIFVVDLVGILILRELGLLMTAVMLAGRTGSAITAEIGSMKMREEVDALTVIGLNPIGVLVFPRLLALIIALPCLTVAANFAAMLGAILLLYFYSGIEPQAFIDRLRVGIDLSTIFAGLIKAPFMAVIIGIIASVEGLKVGGSAESLGRHVTASVVKTIFVVVIIDGAFAIFYAAIDF